MTLVKNSATVAGMPDDRDLAALAALTDGQRRRVFEQVQASPGCTVAELAEALAVGRTLVAFHLAKLTEVGLVEAAAAQRRPGARGRPSQRYHVRQGEVVASVPDRRYDLLAGLLLDGVAEQRRGESALTAMLRAATRRGSELARGVAGSRARSLTAGLVRLEALLSSLGYVPRRDGDAITVLNCPFDRFRSEHSERVCTVNLALADGYLDGLGLTDRVQARLRPCPDSCCVVFEPAAR